MQLFILDTLDNLPRQQISSSMMKTFLWVLRECGAANVPSFAHLRAVQDDLRNHAGIRTEPSESHLGNRFYYNDFRQIVAHVCTLYFQSTSEPSLIICA